MPLELFSEALDLLESLGVGRLAIIGISKGAEAALLVACRESRVHAVVAVAPSSVAWAEVGPADSDATLRSSWTVNGQPVPFVPYDDTWRPPGGAGLQVELFSSESAGHRITFPGESPPETGGADLSRGGSPEADAALGLAAWPAVLGALHLLPAPGSSP